MNVFRLMTSDSSRFCSAPLIGNYFSVRNPPEQRVWPFRGMIVVVLG